MLPLPLHLIISLPLASVFLTNSLSLPLTCLTVTATATDSGAGGHIAKVDVVKLPLFSRVRPYIHKARPYPPPPSPLSLHHSLQFSALHFLHHSFILEVSPNPFLELTFNLQIDGFNRESRERNVQKGG